MPAAGMRCLQCIICILRDACSKHAMPAVYYLYTFATPAASMWRLQYVIFILSRCAGMRCLQCIICNTFAMPAAGIRFLQSIIYTP